MSPENVSTENSTDTASSEKSAVPSISLPKGGGAIRGIGEKFAANPVTGTGSMSVPIATSPGRSGFGPQLSLTYDSGAGNGPFGLGWNISLPSITRKTDKGLPQYLDAMESDVFILSGAEDLVPVIDEATGNRLSIPPVEVDRSRYVITRYRPRIEGLFALIERWAEQDKPENIFWRSISRDNVTSWYGRREESRITNPGNSALIFQWLLCETHDDKGNVVVYDYLGEDSRGLEIESASVHEANRNTRPELRTANRYLHKIRYGNAKPYLPSLSATSQWPKPDVVPGQDWMFEAVFDYGQCNKDNPKPKDNNSWLVRADAFSRYRSGFEIRTYRLCRRVLMFHHFKELGKPDCLVHSTLFTYREPESAQDPSTPGYTVLASVSHWAHQWDENNSTYHSRQRPPVDFDYSEPRVDHTLHTIDPSELENLPVGTQGAGYQWVDLDGEGLSGVLTEQGGAWYYKPGLGDGRFGPMRLVVRKPAMAALASGRQQLLDLAGNGDIDLVDFSGPTPGFHERDREEGWKRHVPFASLPNIDWADANLRFIDLTGDGHTDVLITEDEVFTWYPSLDERGFGPAECTRQAIDEESGPRLIFADGTQTIFLADMCGDGLTDLLRIRNGEVCYWPNLGYGRFGARVTLDNSPVFDHPDLYDPRRIRLADIDGSGPIDIIYLGRDGARLYFNRSGNSLSDLHLVLLPVVTENLAAVQVADLLGNGTACLVWNSHLPADASRPVCYIDLMAGERETDEAKAKHRNHEKPHLLIGIKNNLGGSTEIEYTPSTRFFIADKLAGTPWITRLPFPVHCVSKVTVKDFWRKTEFSSTYSYHHGYFDGNEREFRGFGRVEMVDVEKYDKSSANNINSPYITQDHTLYQPPIKSVTWYHTGAAFDRQRILNQFAQEYFPQRFADRLPDRALHPDAFHEKPLPEPELPADLDADEWRETLRACKGMVLRQEVYELNVDDLADPSPSQTLVRLFSAATHNCNIRRLQPRGNNKHAVFLVTESEALTYHYELDLLGNVQLEPDPRIAHTLTLRHDEYGNPQQSVAIGYGRWQKGDHSGLPRPDLIDQVQAERHIAYSETRYTGDCITYGVDGDVTTPVKHQRLRLPCEVRTYEITGLAKPATIYFDIATLSQHSLCEDSTYPAVVPASPAGLLPIVLTPLHYHQQPANTGPHWRIVEHARSLYFDDSRDDRPPDIKLPFGQHGPRGLKYEDYKLALTDDLLNAVFPGKLDLRINGESARTLLSKPAESGYEKISDQYWMRSGTAGFADDAHEHFFLPERYTDPFDNVTTFEFDPLDLYIKSSADALRNKVEVTKFDFRVLVPIEMIDPNGNFSAVAFDILGMPVASAIMGKQRTESGDNLDGLQLNVPVDEVESFFTVAYDKSIPARWLGSATSRFIYDFGMHVETDGTITYAVRPASACGIFRETHVAAGGETKIHVGVEYSDGTGTVLVKKVQAESDPDSTLPDPSLRWIGSGKTLSNNKGKPVKQYEPYFSDTEHRFDTTEAEREVGVSTRTYYDAAGRVVRVEMPDGTYSRVEFSPWHIKSFDQNDTILEPGNSWYAERSVATASDEDKRTATLAAQHVNTPAQVHLDSLGREAIAIAHNRIPDASGQLKDEYYLTFNKLDAEGKTLWIRDARGNLVMQYITPAKINSDPSDDIPSGSVPCYDIAGNLLFQHSMDAGDRWMLMDAAGKPMLAWDLNQRQLPDNSFVDEQRLYSVSYDSLHRPTARWLKINNEAPIMAELYVYQDALPNDLKNLNGQLVRHYDSGGCIETIRRDFKGNLCEVRRRLNNTPAESVIDWQSNPESQLETEAYTQITEHDALNRMTRIFNWHRGAGSRVAVYLPGYNQRGLLKSERLIIRALKVTRPDGSDDYDSVADVTRPSAVQGTREHEAIEEIRYNAKGQKEYLRLGNGSLTQYDYDPQTFRMRQKRTTRSADANDFPRRRSNLTDSNIVQQLLYTYDPVGNIVEIEDQAYEPVFFKNQMVEPRNRYVYDALYRLIEASGREGFNPPHAPAQREEDPQAAGTFPLTNQTLRNYTQRYTYDAVGNILRMRHSAAQGSWHRRYAHAPDSNRLLRTWEGHDDWNNSRASRKTEYNYDSHGSMRNTANVSPGQYLRWNYSDMLENLNLQGGGRAHYQYDSGKQRTRKLLVRNSGSVEERIYLGGFELYRRYTSNSNSPVEEIETHRLFEGEQCVLQVDDVIRTNRRHADYRPFKAEPILRYQYSNHLGSACLELDHQAKVISYEEYHPYGTSAYRAVKSGIEAPAKRYRYTGMERDEESGLGYHTARYYLSWLGRWGSCDPTELVDGLNLYAYVSANPVRLLDQLGRWGEEKQPEIEQFKDKKKLFESHRIFSETVKQKLLNEPTPTTAREKSDDVDIEASVHDEAVVNIINAAIDAAAARAEAKGVKISEYQLLRSALFDYVTPYRSQSPETSQNVVLRDVDHYIVGRIQEWRRELPWPIGSEPPGPTKSPQRVFEGEIAAEIYDADKRKSFASNPIPDERNAKSSKDANRQPASAPGGRLWAWMGGRHLLDRDKPEQTANPSTLKITLEDVRTARIQYKAHLEKKQHIESLKQNIYGF